MDKKSKGNALDGLLGKLDKQLNAENSNKKAKPQALGIGIAGVVAGVTASNPFGTPTLRSDPLNFKQRSPTKAKARALARQAMLKRHVGGVFAQGQNRYATNPNREDEDQDDDQDVDLKTNEDFIDDNKLKTMDWTEPDGSKTTLKFDEDGTLIGKEKTKSSKSKSKRPEKFSKDLKKAVDKNAVALKDYEESLMTDPVQ